MTSSANNSIDNKDLPVVVVGAGPVGLCCALALHALNVPVEIIEADDETTPRPGSRALFLHNDSLTLLERICSGLGSCLGDQGIQWSSIETRYKNRTVFNKLVNKSLVINKLPTFASIRQPDTEKILRTACDEAGIRIRWGSPLHRLEVSDSGVQLFLAESSLSASYVVGADGARSIVRKEIGVELEGDQAPGCHIVIDFLSQTPVVYQNTRQFNYCHPAVNGRHVLLVPFAGGWQLDMQCHVDDDAEQMSSAEGLKHWLPQIVDEKHIDDIDCVSTYRFNQLVASDFSEPHRRVVLAGESAHLFPPFGARGLNSGIADAEFSAIAISLARQAREEQRRTAAIDDYVKSRRSAALSNREAAACALRAIRTPHITDHIRRLSALCLSRFWTPAACWLDAAPYGASWGLKQQRTRY